MSWDLKTIFNLFKETFNEWLEDRAPRLGAALAFYTMFSLAPLLIIVMAIAGLVFDPETVRAAIIEQFGGLIGPEGAALIENMVAASDEEPATGLIAGSIGLVTLLFGALGVFGQLQDAFNTIWEVTPDPELGIWGMIRQRLFSLTMVLGVSFLLIVSLVLSTALAALGAYLGGLLPGSDFLLTVLNFLLSFGLLTVLFALMFKYVPDIEVGWHSVWIGAALTALLFILGQFLIGLYLGNADVGSAYGAAGSLVILLVWIYYSTQILFFGAEFTQVYTNQFGEGAVPSEHAVPVTEEARAQQGMPRKGDEERAAQPGASLPAPSLSARASAARIGDYTDKMQPTAKAHYHQAGYGAQFLLFAAGIVAGSILTLYKRR